MSDPGFTFYVDNFLGGTLFFSDDQVGKYMRALCAQKVSGHLTLEELNHFAKNDEKVLAKFILDEDGLYFNKRLDKEINKREKHSESQRKKAEKRWNKDTPAMPGHIPGDMPVHMPDECCGNAGADAAAMPDNATEIKSINNNTKTNASNLASSVVCERDGNPVPATKFGKYVLLTADEYREMVHYWGKPYTDAAIADYDLRYPNSPAIKKHTDHNAGIRNYVARGILLEGRKPPPREEPTIKKTPKEDLPTDEDYKELRKSLPDSIRLRTGTQVAQEMQQSLQEGAG